jgi:hypothetical protein
MVLARRTHYKQLMNVSVFDKLAYVDALRAGGVPEDVARAHANALDSALREGVATNESLRSEIGGLRDEMHSEIATLRSEIAALRSEMRSEIAEAKAQITRWMFTAMAGQTALIVALVKLL